MARIGDNPVLNAPGEAADAAASLPGAVWGGARHVACAVASSDFPPPP
jgi:hypothetical protein